METIRGSFSIFCGLRSPICIVGTRVTKLRLPRAIKHVQVLMAATSVALRLTLTTSSL